MHAINLDENLRFQTGLRRGRNSQSLNHTKNVRALTEIPHIEQLKQPPEQSESLQDGYKTMSLQPLLNTRTEETFGGQELKEHSFATKPLQFKLNLKKIDQREQTELLK